MKLCSLRATRTRRALSLLEMILVRALPTRHRKESCAATVFAFHGDMVQSACPLEFPHRSQPVVLRLERSSRLRLATSLASRQRQLLAGS